MAVPCARLRHWLPIAPFRRTRPRGSSGPHLDHQFQVLLQKTSKRAIASSCENSLKASAAHGISLVRVRCRVRRAAARMCLSGARVARQPPTVTRRARPRTGRAAIEVSAGGCGKSWSVHLAPRCNRLKGGGGSCCAGSEVGWARTYCRRTPPPWLARGPASSSRLHPAERCGLKTPPAQAGALRRASRHLRGPFSWQPSAMLRL